jgi:hypothetical protein
MSRTYKDIRPEYRAERRRQIGELERARATRTVVVDRAGDRQEAAGELTGTALLAMQVGLVGGLELWP